MKHIHGGNIYKYGKILDFSANLNPLGMPEKVKEAARESIDAAEHYPDPDCQGLREALGEKERILADKIICGNGAAELIFLLAAALKPEKALLVAPSFAEYEQALKACGCQCRYYELKEKNQFCMQEAYLEALTDDTDIAFLCNPNNPTGALCSREFLDKVLDKCRKLGILLVIDECFLDFLEEKDRYTMKDRLPGGGLFILKAFTKIYAMAGLRLGYGLTEEKELLENMNILRQPWSVSVPAQAAGICALSETEYVKASVSYVKKERIWLEEQLTRYPFHVYKGSANYLFFGADRIDLKEALIPMGILIRDCGNYRGLEKGYYRIAVRTHEENMELIEALDKLYRP